MGNLLSSVNIIGSPTNIIRKDSIHFSYNGLTSFDQLNYSATKSLDAFGFVTQITNPNGKTKYFDREIAAPSSFTELGVSDGDYFGICYQETETNEKGIKSAKYYDGIGQLRCMIVDLGNAPHKNIKTTYNYDDFGRLIEVKNPKNQSTTYTYDDDGRIKTKSQPDLGTIKYLYDKKGNIRFSQNDEQEENNKISYFQYDDLGRTTYIGEAKITVSDFFLLHPDSLAVPNASNVILTSNPTVWFKTTGNKVNKFANITVNSDYFNYNAIRTEHSIEFDSDVQEYTNGIVGPYIMHPTDYYPAITVPASIDSNFEDISKYPEFVKSAVYYDEIPPKMGYIWENMPPMDVVNKLAPKGEMQNLKGKRSVLAYRDNQDDPFHYVFFSYDARGRVESIIRWTENIGFEIVKYGYNSMNKVQFVNVIDAARQYSTWNVYDDNGKLWKVYSKMGDAGSGYDFQNQNYEDIRLPVPMTRPLSPDITYSYTKRNEVDSIIYNSAGANKQIFYDPMGWVDSLIVKRDGQQIFRQILERDDMGMVIQQKSKHPTQPNQDEKTINYTYDNLNRLTEWQNQVNNNGQTFTYDDIGNRTGSTDNGLPLDYYYNTNKNQLSEVNKYADTTFNFYYNSYGAVTSVIKKYEANIIKQETWEYVNSTVPKIYSKTVVSDVWTWRYRRGAFDTREQKRLVVSPLGDGGDNGDAYAQSWEYSLTGVAGEELVLYKGIQTTKAVLAWPENSQTDQGRRVYMAMSRFFVAGTELQYLASGNKELHITDNQGNVRTIFEVYNNSTIRSFDYKPFGEKEWTSVPEDSDRKGFAGSEYDSESDYYAMGYRMYSAEFGRFLAVDPLFEAMPRHSPYHYSYNSPMFWSDPSGLVPVKEKVKNSEKLLSIYSGIEACKSFNQTVYEEPFTAWAYANARKDAADIDEILKGPSAHEIMESHFGGASGAAGSANNGTTSWQGLSGIRIMGSDQDIYDILSYLSDMTGADIEINDDGFITSINQTDKEKSQVFNWLYLLVSSGKDLDIINDDNQDPVFDYSGTIPTVRLNLHGNHDDLEYVGTDGRLHPFTITDQIGHELFGHALDWILGNHHGNGGNFNNQDLESFAIFRENVVKSFYNQVPRTCYQCWEHKSWWFKIWYPKPKWEIYEVNIDFLEK